MTLDIRSLTADDIKPMSAVHHEAWSETYRGTYPDWFIDERPAIFFHGLWQTFLDDDLRPVRGAFVDSTPVGFVRYGRPMGGTAKRGDQCGELLTLYVLPSRRGEGVGAALLRAAEVELTTLGYAEATLSVIQEHVRAIAFYEREGWSTTGETSATDFGNFAPTSVVMKKVFETKAR